MDNSALMCISFDAISIQIRYTYKYNYQSIKIIKFNDKNETDSDKIRYRNIKYDRIFLDMTSRINILDYINEMIKYREKLKNFMSYENVKRYQMEDEFCSKIISILNGNRGIRYSDLFNIMRFEIINECLYYKINAISKAIVVPVKLRHIILFAIHNLNSHSDFHNSFNYCIKKWCWTSVKRDIKAYIERCMICKVKILKRN